MSKSKYAKERVVPYPALLVPFPEGSDVYGAATAYHRLWAQTSWKLTLQMVYRTVKPDVKTFESNAAVLTETIFPHLTPRQILENHTVFGFFSRLADEQVADRWAADLIGRKRPTAAGFKKHLWAVSGRYTRRERWCCLKCVAQDRGSSVPTWRYIHQLAGLEVCPWHGEPLLGFCGNCKIPYDGGAHFRLPGDPCRGCGELVPAHSVAATIGRTELAFHCASVARGDLGVLRPLAWAGFVREGIQHLEDLERASSLIADEMRASWGAKAPLGLTEAKIHKELLLLQGLSQALPRVAIYGSMRRLGCSEATTIVPCNDQVVLESTLARHGLPVGLSTALMLAKPLTAVAALAGISVAPLRAALRDLPDEQKVLVTAAERRRNVPAQLSSGRDLEFEQLRAKYREKVEWILKNSSPATRTLLWKKLPVPMMWLVKHDRQWLDAIRPAKILRSAPEFGAGKSH